MENGYATDYSDVRRTPDYDGWYYTISKHPDHRTETGFQPSKRVDGVARIAHYDLQETFGDRSRQHRQPHRLTAARLPLCQLLV
jgi:hypothetical protein